MRIAIRQLRPISGSVEADAVLGAAEQVGAPLAVRPELAVPGYAPPEHRSFVDAGPAADARVVAETPFGVTAVPGTRACWKARVARVDPVLQRFRA